VGVGTGDTVNTASRMESNSEVLKILCSEAAAKLVIVQDPSLLLIPRGAIPIKGKMKMKTFWVHESNSGVIPQGDTTEIALDIEIQPKRAPTVVRSISLS
jgi:class 3 adenylate cyclase